MTMNVNVACYAKGADGAGFLDLALMHVQQHTPPPGCFSFSSGVLRFAAEDVRRFPKFIVRLWVHPSGRDMREIELQSSALTVDGEATRRITAHEDDEETRG
jgi:hypothetical protein